MKTRKFTTLMALSVLTLFSAVTLVPTAAFAGSTGTRNTAIGLTAATILAAAKGQKTAAIALGAGSAYAWKRYTDKRKNESYEKGYQQGVRDARYYSNSRYNGGNYYTGSYYSNANYYKAKPATKKVAKHYTTTCRR